MDDDRRRWDERYADREPGEPTAPTGLGGLDRHVPSSGRALDLACGLGEVATWLAARGLTVDALDVSSVAIGALERRAAELGLGDRVRARAVDLGDGLPSDVTGPYDVVVCQRYRDPALYDVIPRLLAPGGLAVVTVLSAVGLRGEEVDPGPYHAAAGELDDAFGDRDDVEILRSVEGDGEATVVMRARAGSSR